VSGRPPRPRHASSTALLGVALLVLTLSGPASAATPCGQQVVDDWWDNGRIDRIYDLRCYAEAEDAIPADIRPYSDVDEVIARALQAASRGRLSQGGDDPTPTGSGPSAPPVGTTQVASVDDTGSGSIPVPLIVLAVMSIALLAAGGIGGLIRRRRGDELDGRQ
jgi:hypothetical protein